MVLWLRRGAKVSIELLTHYVLRHTGLVYKDGWTHAACRCSGCGGLPIDPVHLALQQATPKDRVHARAFEKLDTNRSGNISVNELQDILLSTYGNATADPEALPPG